MEPPAADVEVPPEVGADGQPPSRSVRESNVAMNKARKTTRNGIELACVVLSNNTTRRIMECMRAAVRPCRETFGREQVMSKTQRGVLELHTSWADGKFGTVAMETWKTLCNGPALKRASFSDFSPSALAASREEDEFVAQRFFDLVVGLMGKRLLTGMYYSHCVPCRFVKLLHLDSDVVKAELEHLKALWVWLNKLEKEALTQSTPRTTLSCIPVFGWVWVREVFTILEEASFEWVPAELKGSLEAAFMGFQQTKVVEDSFKATRTASTKNEQGALGRKARWATLQASSILPGYDRKKLPITEAARKSAAKTIPNSVFDGDCLNFSLGQEVLKTLSTDTWSSMSTQNWSLQPVVLEVCFKKLASDVGKIQMV